MDREYREARKHGEGCEHILMPEHENCGKQHEVVEMKGSWDSK